MEDDELNVLIGGRDNFVIVNSRDQIYGPVPTLYCRWVHNDYDSIDDLKWNLQHINMYNYINPIYIQRKPLGVYCLSILLDGRRRIPRFGKSW